MRRAIFLDRDGVINVDKGYVHKIEDFKLIPGTIDALGMLQKSGFLLIIMTNQSGIGRRYYTEEDFRRFNSHMLKILKDDGIEISKVYFCPHSPEENCDCRKPSVRFIKKAEKEFDIDLKNSYVIGDMTTDIKTGIDAGCRTILVETGKSGKDGRYDVKPDFVTKDLYSAARLISGNNKQ